MCSLAVIAPGIIANTDYYTQIQIADHASILLLSDTHGGIAAVQWLFSEWKEKCDACLFAGDGAEDMLHVLGTAAPDAACLTVNPCFVFACGNCDTGKYNLPHAIQNNQSVFSVPFYQTIVIAHERILLTHGHLACVEFDTKRLFKAAAASQCGIAVYGHTHIQHFKYKQHAVCINPGSLIRPRGNSPAGFAVLHIDSNGTEDMTKTLVFYTLNQDSSGTFSVETGESYTF